MGNDIQSLVLIDGTRGAETVLFMSRTVCIAWKIPIGLTVF